MVSRFKDHILGPDTHANRPAASGVPEASIYECTTHGLIYKNVAGTWITYGVLIPPGGTTGQAIVKNSSTDYDIGWGAGGGGGGGTPETYDAAVTAALTGLVHRWKFDDASGATVADSVGSLPLTMAGTYTRHTASPTGFGTTITATGGAVSSGPGSIPIGSNDRCIIMLYRTASTASQDLISLGTGATRQNFSASRLANSSSAPGNLQLVCWGDDTVVGFPFSSGPEVATSAGEWSLLAIGYKNAITTTFLYHDGVMLRKVLGGALNTASSNFTAGTTLIGAIDDVIVLNNWPGKLALDRLLSAAAGVAWTPH